MTSFECKWCPDYLNLTHSPKLQITHVLHNAVKLNSLRKKSAYRPLKLVQKLLLTWQATAQGMVVGYVVFKLTKTPWVSGFFDCCCQLVSAFIRQWEYYAFILEETLFCFWLNDDSLVWNDGVIAMNPYREVSLLHELLHGMLIHIVSGSVRVEAYYAIKY